ADGEWHRLHPATPLLKGGIALLAIIGVIIANLRERLVELFLPRGGGPEDPLDFAVRHGWLGWGLLAVLGVLLLLVLGYWLSWRMHSFRITDDVVEVRSGVVFRRNRRARLDRIQSINVARPLLARLLGASKLEINQAGQDANVNLEYLHRDPAIALRGEVLRLASGATSGPAAPSTAAPGPALVDRAVHEFTAGEEGDEGESVVRIPVGRLLGSILLSGYTLFVVVSGIASFVGIAVFQEYVVLVAVLPALIAFAGVTASKLLRSLRYRIVPSRDGVRVSYGLASTTSETLPPGRVHSVQIVQPLLWRPVGWWQLQVNRASHSSAQGAAGQANTTLLPVGTTEDALAVLALLLPGLEAGLGRGLEGAPSAGAGPDASADGAGDAERGRGLLELALLAPGGAPGFSASPRRAAWLRPFSWRRNGAHLGGSAVLLRKGAVWRSLTIVPLARVQSTAVRQGPVLRLLDLGVLQLHTVAGPVRPTLGAVDRAQLDADLARYAAAAVAATREDTSDRWGRAPASARAVPADHERQDDERMGGAR
ncbi:MAG: PH domain-containing protein, partial [Microbacteriaceae bacterium]